MLIKEEKLKKMRRTLKYSVGATPVGSVSKVMTTDGETSFTITNKQDIEDALAILRRCCKSQALKERINRSNNKGGGNN